jgi:hypothetical protein
MMWIIGLLAMVAVNALFNDGVFGINARWLLLIIVITALGYVAYYELYHKESYEQLIQTEGIVITRQLDRNSEDQAWYGQNEAYYYKIYPAVHYRISRTNSCRGFDPYNITTWCGEERYFPRCNTPNDPHSCLIYSAQK